MFQLLAQHYRKLVQIIDFQQIIPLLEEWSADMVHFCECSPDILFFTDGKPCYNGHYGFSGAKVQHVLQVDGICYSFTCPFHHHDAMVLQESSMLTMLSVLFVHNDPLRPVKCIIDKAYGHTQHLRPLHTSLELRLMNHADHTAVEKEGAKNKGPQKAKMSFNNIVRRLTHVDYFATHRILQSGRSNWPYLHCLWDLQVLFYNLFTCTGHGNPTNGTFGIAPPSVEEYLFSAIVIY